MPWVGWRSAGDEIANAGASREGLNLAFSFFFRDQQVLDRVVEHSLPRLAGRSHPRIWDAGAAMG